MNITIVGSGNVGAAFGAALCNHGHSVVFYDIHEKTLPSGFNFTTNWTTAFQHAEVFVICVPTELVPDGTCDLRSYDVACEKIAEAIKENPKRPLILQKSTCPPGTARQVILRLKYQYGLTEGVDYLYAVFPSFLNMGDPAGDEMRQVKCLVGSETADVEAIMRNLLHWAKPRFSTYINVEFAKYVNQLLHASIISIWNELFVLGKSVNVDTDWVARSVSVGRGLESFYRVHGKAWGGHCLPKDVTAFLKLADQVGAPMPILQAVLHTNEGMRKLYGVQAKHWDEIHRRTTNVESSAA